IVLMRDGLIEQQGAPLELFERPATRFVAGFLGSPRMNFIPCRLTPEDGDLTLAFKGGERLRLDHRRASNLATSRGRDLIFGVRPEHFGPFATGASLRPGQALLTVTVELVQPTGARTFVQFPFGGVDVTAELPAHSFERSGTTAQILIDMTRTI